MSFKLHGNYCGPGWSAGKYQPSVVSSIKPIDRFDNTCKMHDAEYALGKDLAKADALFALRNISTNPIRLASAIGVGAQGVLRYFGVLDRYAGGDNNSQTTENTPFLLTHPPIQIDPLEITNQQIKQDDMRIRNRNRIQAKLDQATPQTKTNRSTMEKVNAVRNGESRLARAFAPARIAAAPVSIGTTITASEPAVSRTSQGIKVLGREFLTTVRSPSTASTFEIGAIAPLHPMYYKGTVMANTARGYGQYRFNKVAIHYITRQSTATAGEVILTFTENDLEPSEDGTNESFLPRVMTKGAAVLGPLWQNHSMAVVVEPVFRKVDAFNAANFNDNVAGEIQVYTQCPNIDTMGYLLIDYELEFRETVFTPHSASLPLAFSSVYGTFSRTLATTSGGGVLLTPPSSISSQPNNTIYKLVIDSAASSFGLLNLATAFKTGTEYADASGAEVTASTNLPLSDGSVVFGVLVNNLIILYSSIESALSGSGSGQVLWTTTSLSAAYSIAAVAYCVRLDPAELVSAA